MGNLNRPGPTSSLLFYKPPTKGLWDNIIHYADGTYFLYFQDGIPSRSFGLATSRDLIHWTYEGTAFDAVTNGLASADAGSEIYRIREGRSTRYFRTMASVDQSGIAPPSRTSETRDSAYSAFWSTATIAWKLLESENLYDWKISKDSQSQPALILEREQAARHKSAPRFYGYTEQFDGTPLESRFGYVETDDLRKWSQPSPVHIDLPDLEGKWGTLEIGGAIDRGGTLYFMAGLCDQETFARFEDTSSFSIGFTTLVASSPKGPLRLARKNARLMVGNGSYFLRFMHTPEGVLVNHQSWEPNPAKYLGLDGEATYLAPLKRADWDAEGTLRLKWWEGNDRAKTVPIPNALGRLSEHGGITFLAPEFDSEEAFVLEGDMEMPEPGDMGRRGLYIESSDREGVAFLVRPTGDVECGLDFPASRRFVKRSSINREVSFGSSVKFRLVRKRMLTEYYLNDYLMQCFSLPSMGTGRIGLIGPITSFSCIKTWYCRPQ